MGSLAPPLRREQPFFGPGWRVGEARRPGPVWLSELDDPDGGDFERDVELQGQDIEDQYDACWLFNQDLGGYEQLQDFMPSKKFNGAKPGWAFKLGAHGCGYYRDCEPIAASQERPGRTVLQLDSILESGHVSPARRRAPRVRTRKRPPRSSARHRGSKEFTWREEVELGDASHRECNLWACDSYNGNCSKRALTLLKQTGADFCMLQELRVLEEHCGATEREAAWAGWSLSVEPARRTEAGCASAGVGVAVRSCMGMAQPRHIGEAVESFQELSSRVHVRWVSSVCRGGIYVISIYLFHSEGLSTRNLDLLQAVAAIISRLKAPWVLAGDFNVEPQQLSDSGWLLLVGGVVKAPAVETCGKVVLDYFVIPKCMERVVVGVARIMDFGMQPHCPVRLYLKASPRALTVRCLVAPTKFGAVLPSGCANKPLDYAEVVRHGQAGAATVESINQSCGKWLDMVESELADVMCFDQYQRRRASGRANGPRFAMKPALGTVGSPLAKVSHTTEAWRLAAAWLRRIEQGLRDAAGANGVLDHGAMRARYRFCVADWKLLGSDDKADQFRQWHRSVTFAQLQQCGHVQRLLVEAHEKALALDRQDQRGALLSWRSWLTEGPADGLRRQHKVSRTAAGWTPSLVAAQDQPNGEGAECDEGDEEQLCWDEQDGPVEAPCDRQQTAEETSGEWATIWQADAVPPVLDWPSDLGEALPPPCVTMARRAMATFPVETGLGWDRLHPRALLRLSDQAIIALLRIFILAELLGEWPEAVGVVVIAMLAKPQGGFRPIGLFPTLVRVWMRLRLPVAQAWQAANERGYFYAGPAKGAQVAAWKQAARAEMAKAMNLDYATVLLDLIKAFETIPHDWLVLQARKFGYNLYLLRLSLASYKLARTIRVAGTYAHLVVATRGITAGAGLATIELRLLLIECMDAVAVAHPVVKLTVYVDDVALEAMATYDRVKKEIVAATRKVHYHFTEMRLAFSETKNACAASKVKLGVDIALALRMLRLKHSLRVTSLGCGLGAGSWRNAGVARMRLHAFRKRRSRFQTLRRAGVDTARLIRTGGSAAMTYGQAVMGVSDSVLLLQRRAVVATLNSTKGFGELDITLMLADASYSGKADPVFQAHLDPLWHWALAVWEGWLGLRGLSRTVDETKGRLLASKSPWASTAGPVAAMILTAERLKWVVKSAVHFTTDTGQELDLKVDSPAYLKQQVIDAVWRWRWRRIQANNPSWAGASEAGAGAFMRPIFRLLDSRFRHDQWGPQERAGLRSLVAGRQWPQIRLAAAGYTDSHACYFCQQDAEGVEGVEGVHPGTLAHRHWECPTIKEALAQVMPQDLVKECASQQQQAPLDSLYWNRGLVPIRADEIPPRPIEETFIWRRFPENGVVEGTVYMDGSQFDGKPFANGLCTRCGWAFVAVNDRGIVTAIAYGLTPPWVDGIHGAETWAFQMATTYAMPGTKFRTDCESVWLIFKRGAKFATGAKQYYARCWANIFANLDDQVDVDMAWMPAHTKERDIGVLTLSNGELLRDVDRRANALADHWAKIVARSVRVPERLRRSLAQDEERAMQLALWLGRATAVANGHRLPAWRGRDAKHFVRPPRAPGAAGDSLQDRRRLCRPFPAAPVERTPSLGGHTLEPAGGRWRCTVCRLDGPERIALAAGKCRGPPRERWRAEALRHAPAAERTQQRAHKVTTTGDVDWCKSCGAYAELRGKGLARACPGRPRNKWAAERLRDLQSGIHPVSGRRLASQEQLVRVQEPITDHAYAEAVTRGQKRWEALRDKVRKRTRVEESATS